MKKIKSYETLKRCKIEEINEICPNCKEKKPFLHFHLHHIDGNRNNNDIDNLMAICCHCHWKIDKEQMKSGQAFKYKKI